MAFRILMVVVLFAFGLPALAQQSTSYPGAGIPEDILYDSFFFRVAWLENHADAIRAEGRGDSIPRSLVRRQFHLTAQEESALKLIALDWHAKHNAILAMAGSVTEGGIHPNDPKQLEILASQRKQNVLDHLAQLRAAMGTERFRLFDRAVRRDSRVTGPGIVPRPR